ncbi:hypothetical protein RJ639_018332 [Escallonia herrerae]|uniref:Proline-rich protein PRCC n=1 Tax=Escallonia herrerae TaxID=1293975 RepID=A0AA88V7N7_9ASTE|nr:hypothetical protein RJ639_018332 [Escallonia herrerae]
MDSLLATYASSDEEAEEEKQESHQPPTQSLQRSNPPKSSSIFSFLAPPKASPPTSIINDHSPSAANHNRPAKPSSLFSSLPQPKSEKPNSAPAPSGPKPKKVVQFRPPVNQISKSNDDDDEEEEDYGKQRRNAESITQTPSVKSFLSSIPAPKNAALGSLSMSLGTGRRSIIDADAARSNSGASGISTEANVSSNISEQSIGVSDGLLEYTVSGDASDWGLGSEQYLNYETYGGYDGGGGGGGDASSLVSESGDYANYDSYSGGYGSYETEGHYDYESKWVDKSDAIVEPDVSRAAAENVVRVYAKRGRKDVLPDEMIEVQQDELMKNRPREDKAKLTGIAFGPSYQKGIRIGNFNSADTSVEHYSQGGVLKSYGWEMPVSAKGKPTKLHKRKHQIGSLYFDMKQKEMELAERRAKGFLTKAETQAKYGW